jgi:hypothetical protein
LHYPRFAGNSNVAKEGNFLDLQALVGENLCGIAASPASGENLTFSTRRERPIPFLSARPFDEVLRQALTLPWPFISPNPTAANHP